jgi:tetratricopeptide (TPR) repeat protein
MLLVLAGIGAMAGWHLQSWWTGPESIESIEPLLAQQDWKRAERLLERYLTRNPNEPAALMMLGRVYAGRADFTHCAEILEKIAPTSRQRAEALFRAGQAWLAAQHRRQAERVWNACRSLEGDSPAWWYYQQQCRRELCGLFALEQRREEFLAMTSEMLDPQLGGNRYDILFARTRFEFEKIDPTGVLAQLQLAIDSDPDDMYSRRALGLYHLEAGQLQQSRAQLFRCVQLAPDDGTVWEAWLQCLYNAGDLNGLADAVAQMPERFAASRFRSIVAEQQGMLEQAIEFARQNVAAEPDRPEAYYRLSQLLLRAGNEVEAQSLLTRSNEVKEQRDRMHSAYEAYRDRRANSARELAELAAHFGLAFEGLGNRTEAMEWYRAALAEDNGHETSSVRLQQLESAQNTPSVELPAQPQ